MFTARRLLHYFQSLTIVVMIDLPICKVLQMPDIAGQMVCWMVELSEFDIQYEPRGLIKGLVYTNFMVELSPKDFKPNPNDVQWVLSVDGSSKLQGSGIGVILEGPNGLLIEHALRFSFKASNNKLSTRTG